MSNARGGADAVKAGRKLLEKTTFLPEEAVLEMLKKAGRGDLHIVLPRSDRMSYWLKRDFPRLFRNQLMKLSKKQIERVKKKG